MGLFWEGLVIGVLLALPIGPTMILCVRYSLAFGTLVGLITGAGAAFADAIYGVIAGYGLWVVSDFMDQYAYYFHITGSILLIYLGVKTFLQSKPSVDPKDRAKRPELIKLFITTFILTGASPLTFLGVAAFCAAFGVGQGPETALTPWSLGGGIFIGACLFWHGLSLILTLIRKKLSQKKIVLVGKVSGILLVLLGIGVFLYSFFLK